MTRAILSAVVLATLPAGLFGQGYGPGSYGGDQLRVCLARVDDQGILHVREFHAGPPVTQKVLLKRQQGGKEVYEEVQIKNASRSETVLVVDLKAAKVFDAGNKPVDPGRV